MMSIIDRIVGDDNQQNYVDKLFLLCKSGWHRAGVCGKTALGRVLTVASMNLANSSMLVLALSHVLKAWVTAIVNKE